MLEMALLLSVSVKRRFLGITSSLVTPKDDSRTLFLFQLDDSLVTPKDDSLTLLLFQLDDGSMLLTLLSLSLSL